MKLKISLIFFAVLLRFATFSQTITLQPTGTMGKDAVIQISDNGAVDGNTNFGTNVGLVASRINSGGNWFKARSLIQFDLSIIPKNAIITSATLTLYGVAHNNSGQTNTGVLQRCINYWDEGTVTWNNQPSTTGSGQISLSASTSATQNYVIDVQKSIQDMVKNPSRNFGWILKLNGESTAATSALSFASSDYTATSGITPKLEITYTTLTFKQTACSTPSTANGSIDLTVSGTSGPYSYSWTNESGSVISTSQDVTSLLPGAYKVAVTDANSKIVYGYAFLGSKGTTSTISFQPSANFGIDAPIATKLSSPSTADANSELSTSFNTFRWTVSGLWQTNRSLIALDLSSIPSYAVITDAKLYLYGTDHATTGQSNAGSLQRVISPWAENFVTWNNQPVASATGKIEISQTTTATENKVLNITSHVQDMVRAPESNFGWLMKLNGETVNSFAKMIFASSDYVTDVTKRPKFEITFFIPDMEENRNWVDVESFDNSGNTMSKSRSYLDGLGRGTQQQAIDITNGNVLASANVFDEYGRPVLQTLTAPVFQNGIYYKNGFIKVEGQNYSYVDFNSTNNTPSPIENTEQGSLGWYYSNNNTSEPYVPASSYPFSTVEFYADPLSRTKRISGVGENHYMGSGHENKVYYMSNLGELDYAFGYRKSYLQSLDPTSTEITPELSLYKTLQVDADGKTSVVYTNSSGQVIATCLSGQNSSCASQKVSQKLDFRGEKGINIHIPYSKIGTLKLPVDNSTYASEGNGTTAQIINYSITDLKTGHKLVLGTDYTFNRNSNSRLITFLNGYQNSDGYFKISFDFTQTFLDACYLNCYPLPANNYCIPNIVSVNYELDYSDWTLNYYDISGQLVKTVSPQAIDCTYDPITNHTISINQINKNIVKTPSCTSPLHTISTSQVANYDQNLKVKVQIYGSGVCNSAEESKYATSPIAEGTFNSTLSSVSSSIQISQTYTPVTNVLSTEQSGRGPLDPQSPSPPPRHSYFIELSLCGNTSSGLQSIPNTNFILKPGFVTNLNEMIIDPYGYNNEIISHELNIESNIMASYSDVRVKIENIQIVTYEYFPLTTFNGYWQQSGMPFNYTVGMEGGAYDNMICREILGITSVLEKMPTPNHINQSLATKYNYNKLGWLIKTSSTDEGVVNLVYDTEGKIRFSQNADQLANGGKFNYLVYDRSGRVTQVGEYNPTLSGDATTLVFQPYNSDGTVPSAPPSGTSVHSIVDNLTWNYPNKSTQQTYYAYDIPQSDFPTTSYYTNYSQKFKDGQLSKVWNASSTTWYGYDDLGRSIWGLSSIAGQTTYKSIAYNYNSDGLLDNFEYQKDYSAERFITKYIYDANKRFKQVQTSFNGTTFTTKQNVEYYLHGALKRNELDGTLQGLDYVYTINGLLKSVNDPALSYKDPGDDSYPGAHSSFKKDVFGFTLDYYTNDYVRQNTLIETYTPTGGNTALANLYSGQIKSSRWKTAIPTAAQSNTTHVNDILQFSYKYDSKNQLTEAIFGTIVEGTLNGPTPGGASPLFTEAASEYRVNNISYDKIGNIKFLRRQGKASSLPMDDMTYNYDSSKPNRLNSISDAATTSSYGIDIQTGQTSTNYQYNSIGQLIKEVQPDYNYTYNAYGNVTAIKKSNGNNVVTIEYNAMGLRQKKTSYNPSTNAVTGTIWYVYDNGGTLLSTYSAANTQTDLQIYGAGRLGVYDRSSTSFIYELTDHLGNVRATVRNNGGNAEVLSFSDYYPHGSTLPDRNYSSSIGYKYAYQGQEKDGETGFLNFELRQYDARIGRWFNPDPMGQYHSPYLAMGNNPISRIDPTGGADSNHDGWDDLDQNHDGQSDDLFSDNFDDNLWGSEFDNNYQGLYDGGGAHNANGSVTSNYEMSLDALNLYFDNHKIDGVTGSFQDFFTAAYKVENQGSNGTEFGGQQDIVTKWISSFNRKSYGQSLNGNKKKAKKWEWYDPKPKGAYDYCFTYDECQKGALIVGGIAMTVVAAPVIVEAAVAYSPVAVTGIGDAFAFANEKSIEYFVLSNMQVNAVRQTIINTTARYVGKYIGWKYLFSPTAQSLFKSADLGVILDPARTIENWVNRIPGIDYPRITWPLIFK
jgi:RHS repeat-associated protein